MTSNAARPEHRGYYAGMAALLLVLNIVGFAPSYLLPLSTGRAEDLPIIHVHAFVAFAWLLLFCAQTMLIASGRPQVHRALRLLGIALATTLVLTGVMVEAKAAQVSVEAGMGADATRFTIVPLTILALFAGFFAAAIANLGRPTLHRRLMLVATIVIMPPAVGRVVGRLILEGDLPRQIMGAAPPSLVAGTVAALAADLLLLIPVAYDWRTRGRPHPVYLYSLALILAVQFARFPLSQTQLWHGLMDVFLSF